MSSFLQIVLCYVVLCLGVELNLNMVLDFHSFALYALVYYFGSYLYQMRTITDYDRGIISHSRFLLTLQCILPLYTPSHNCMACRKRLEDLLFSASIGACVSKHKLSCKYSSVAML